MLIDVQVKSRPGWQSFLHAVNRKLEDEKTVKSLDWVGVLKKCLQNMQKKFQTGQKKGETRELIE